MVVRMLGGGLFENMPGCALRSKLAPAHSNLLVGPPPMLPPCLRLTLYPSANPSLFRSRPFFFDVLQWRLLWTGVHASDGGLVWTGVHAGPWAIREYARSCPLFQAYSHFVPCLSLVLAPVVLVIVSTLSPS
eukprot:Gb_34603 [translate_table: standard]